MRLLLKMKKPTESHSEIFPIESWLPVEVHKKLWRCKNLWRCKKKLWRGGHRSETAIFQAFFVALINDEWRWSWWSWFNNELWSTPRDLWPLRHLIKVIRKLVGRWRLFSDFWVRLVAALFHLFPPNLICLMKLFPIFFGQFFCLFLAFFLSTFLTWAQLLTTASSELLRFYYG